MKKKLIAMMCFVLLTTATSVYVMLDASKNKANNSTKNVNLVTNTNTPTPTPTTSNNNTDSPDATKISDIKDSDNVKASGTTHTSQNTIEDYTLYEVKKGDTLSTICKNYESICPTSILSKAILKVNNLSSASDIKETMTIKIPDKYINGSSYTVKTGDSLYTIASSLFGNSNVYKSIEILKADNYLTNESLKVGDKLFISVTKDASTESSTSTKTDDSKSTSASSTTTASTNSVPISTEDLISYTVKSGDTLSTLSKRYEKYCPLAVSSKVILKANGFTDANGVKVGTEIKLPEKYLTNGAKYTVKAGDTLSTIAKEHLSNMTLSSAVEKIKNDNFISSNSIKVGQQLYLTDIAFDDGN